MVHGLILGVDTCTAWMNLALVDKEGKLLCEYRERAATHATGLVPAMLRLLCEAGAGPEALLALGAVVGPGSFTGLRVGLAAVLGMAAARGLPIRGIGSLEALAAFAPASGEGLAVMDARRGRVYAGRFSAGASGTTRLTPDEDLPPEEVLHAGGPPAWGVGDGISLVAGWPEGCLLRPDVPNLALPAARSAARRLLEGAPVEPLSARYVREPDAKLPAR